MEGNEIRGDSARNLIYVDIRQVSRWLSFVSILFMARSLSPKSLLDRLNRRDLSTFQVAQ